MKERLILDDKYVIVRPLGSGPTGSLYEAENLILGKRVAIKWINPSLARRPGVAERVLAKAREAAGLDHPNIASLLDLGEYEGAPYIVTEPLGGYSLEREIDAAGASEVSVACDLILQILSALDYAHANGVLHGALSPSNVLISYPRPGVPWVKVTDFGLFRALEDFHGDAPDPAPAGGYRAPELALGADIDQRVDVYSTAALLHALIHGVPPGLKPETSSRVPHELNAVLDAALRADPAERIDSAQTLSQRLAPFAQEPSRSGEIRLSSPPSIRFVNAPAGFSQPLPLASRPEAESAGRERASLEIDHANAEAPVPDSCVTESLLRNPRFPSDRAGAWTRRWRALRSKLASNPNVGAAWLFALASVGAGIACALLAAWLQ